MRIGLIAPPWIPVPPPAYGGTEYVVGLLASGLALAGHTVKLAAAPGSSVPGVEVISPLVLLPAEIGVARQEWLHVLPAVEALSDCDVVVDHSGLLGAMLSAHGPAPALHVLHGPLDRDGVRILEHLAARCPDLRLVGISASQLRAAPHLPFAGVCHNGIDVDAVPFRAAPDPDGHLVFLGRMSPDKGAAEAIAIARACGRRILIAAKCREPAEREYFARAVRPHLGPDVEWLGEVHSPEKFDLLGGAAALVFPISWPEPFGMVMIEAMACGTPVLATRRGAVPEIVLDGVTGFVRDDAAALASAAELIGLIDRRACREHVARTFSGAAMTRAYERVIHAVAGGVSAAERLPVAG